MESIRISDDLRLREIKARFMELFPHLRLEFFSEKHGVGEASTFNTKLDDELFLKDVRSIQTEGELSIDGNTTTADFETGFSSLFGINVQILRKSGNMWLQTTVTDDWSLDKQEQKSKEEGLYSSES